MKKLITIILLFICSVAVAQKMKAIDIMVRYENKDYLVTYVIDTTQLTSKGWIATVNVYQAGEPVFLGQRGFWEKGRWSSRPSREEIEYVQTALTLCKKKTTNDY